MTKTFVLGIDIGTHSSRVAIIDNDDTIVWSRAFKYSLNHISPSHIEQDVDAIARQLVDTLALALNENYSILTVGVSCQRSSVVAWRADTMQTLSPVLSWMDTRGEKYLAPLRASAKQVQSLSGLVVSPHYGGSKIRWLSEALAPHGSGRLRIAPLVSYVCARLLQGHPYICDESNAGRTQCFDVQKRIWSQPLITMFGVDSVPLPKLLPTCAEFGHLDLDANISLRAVCGDQNAAYYALRQQPFFNHASMLAVNFGTGAFILGECDARASVPGLLKTLMWSDEKKATYAIEATVNGAGSALEWLCAQWIKFSDDYTATREYFFASLNQWVEPSLTDADDPYPIFINSLGGLGSPYWRTDIETTFVDIDLLSQSLKPIEIDFNSSRKNIARYAVAVVESIVFLAKINIDKIEQQREVSTLVVSGGLTKSYAFCQKLADVTGKAIIINQQKEASLIGAVKLARKSIGLTTHADTHEHSECHTAKSLLPKNNDAALKRFDAFKQWIEKT